MRVDANVRVIQEFIEAHNAHDIEAMAELVADDVRIGSGADPAGVMQGRAAAVDFWTRILATFPDHHFEAVTITAEGDRVVVELEESGTMRGALGPNAATGREFRVAAALRFGVDRAGQIDTITS